MYMYSHIKHFEREREIFYANNEIKIHSLMVATKNGRERNKIK